MPKSKKSKTAGKPRHHTGHIVRTLLKSRSEATEAKTAFRIGMHPSTFNDVKNGKSLPTHQQVVLMCRYFNVPFWTFYPKEHDLFLQEHDGLRWRSRVGLAPRDLHIQAVTEAVLRGRSPTQVGELVPPLQRDQDEVAQLIATARAGLGRSLIELVFSRDAGEVQEPELAAALSHALTAIAGAGRQIVAHVVRDVAHPEFKRDPIVPFLVARVAHQVVARFLAENHGASTIGIAGGIHLATFVRTIGPESGPFPDGSDRQFVLVPLTLENFHDHRFELADSLVGELHTRAIMQLVPTRALSFKLFGYLEGNVVGSLETASVFTVRTFYRDLDVAIFGCGDRSDDGWIEWTLKLQESDEEPATDVCLNMISEDGTPIALPSSGGVRRMNLGVSIGDIRTVAGRRNKLALLLASGESKGLPITLVVRARCANAVICDESAARAALRVLAARSE
jgi:hypothetical protein